LALEVLKAMTLCKSKVNEASKHVVEVKMHDFVVSWDLELSNKLHKMILQLTLEKDTGHHISIGKTPVILSGTPLCGKGQQFGVAEVE
jgi:hypothetical protein